MLRDIGDRDVASMLGVLAHLKKTPTVKVVAEHLARRFEVSEEYAEARLHEIVENTYHGLIINNGVVELFNEKKYELGKKHALLKKPTAQVSKDYVKGYREGKELLKYLYKLGLRVENDT